MGKASCSAIVTLVERKSRYLILAALPGGHGAPEVRDALTRVFGDLPVTLRRSLTWDQGSEMRHWRQLELRLDMPVYFCHPRSPWERGSNENANRQLRYWLRKSTDLSEHSQSSLDRITDVINNQPRRLLRWDTAADRYSPSAVR